MSQTLSVTEIIINGYTLSVTTRDCGDDPHILEELTYKTVKAWLWMAGLIQVGKFVLDQEIGSVESRLAKDMNTEIPPAENDSRVTVWCHWRSQRKVDFHLNSDDIPQVALSTYAAQNAAMIRLEAEFPKQDASQSNVEGANSSAAANQAPSTPNPATTPAFSDAVINATRAPNPNTPQYADGQLVAFTVNKIAASSNKGSATFQMWTALGSQYPTLTVYKLDSKGQPKKDYETIAPVLNSLGLSFEKPEAHGAWRMVCKAAHAEKDGKVKEYLNVQSLTPI